MRTALALAGLSLGLAPAVPGEPATPRTAAEPVVLLELFTSQGCSSCPPADRLLTRLGEEEAGRILPLAFHVDYWNYIGWTDPFSSADWSKRQRSYGRAFGSGRIYTPQLVINGRADCVGSQEATVRAELEKARRRSAGGRLQLALRTDDARQLALDIAAEALIDGEGRWDVWVAVFENDLTTPVGRGENGGRTLHNSHVVRALDRAFGLPARAGERITGSWSIEPDPAWRRDRLGVAVFLQDPRSLAVHAAAAVTPRHRED